MKIQDLTEADRSAIKLEILCLMAKIGVAAVLQAIANVANDCGDGKHNFNGEPFPVDPTMLEVSAIISQAYEDVNAIIEKDR